MFTRIQLDLETVTPAFVGGSDAQHAEWSGKGVRGQLRWWLRALAGGVYSGDAAKTRALEQSLFGATDERSPIRILTPGAPPVETTESAVPGARLDETGLAEKWGRGNVAAVKQRLKLQATNPIGYLGYGPITYVPRQGSKYLRARIPHEKPLRLLLQRQTRNGISTEAIELFGRALWCWLHLGGIGGRSRRGFGSLTVKGTRDADSFGPFPKLVLGSAGEFETTLKGILADARRPSAMAEWTHFTSATRIYISDAHWDTWDQAMVVAGAWLIAFRRRYGRADDERKDVQNRDYHWLKTPKRPEHVPDRAGFGLPLPFRKEKDFVVAWGDGGRRASPLLIHVARFGTSHHLVLTHIPARLVPKDEELRFRGIAEAPTKEQQAIVEVFLDDLANRGLVKAIV